MSEDIQKLIQARKNPVNGLQDLDKRLKGTRDGFIFYTTNFRKDFDAKMCMLGRLQQENEKLKADYGTKAQVERDLLLEENQQLKSKLELYENGVYYSSEIDKLEKENEKLKKELEEQEEYSANAINKQVSRGIDLINQQKEFVNWLENWYKITKEQHDELNEPVRKSFLQIQIDVIKEILSKYKEIIGDV